jgi:hypothetical protein
LETAGDSFENRCRSEDFVCGHHSVSMPLSWGSAKIANKFLCQTVCCGEHAGHRDF